MQTKTHEEKQKSQQAILQLGQRALAQLALEAKAVQIQAKQAELELMMDQAYQGNMTPLQQWLRVHGPHIESDLSAPSPAFDDSSEESNSTEVIATNKSKANSSSTESPSLAVAGSVQVEEAIQGWNDLLPFARKRLKQLNQSSGRSSTDPSSRLADSDLQADLPHSQHLLEGDTADYIEHNTGESDVREFEQFEPGQGDVQQGEVATETQQQSQDDSTPNPLSEMIAGLGLDQVSAANLKPATQKGRWRGAIVSAVFHLVLLVLLAVVTIENPMKNGLLALVSGGSEESTEIESFEISNDQQVIEPTDSSEISEPTSQTNLSEALPGLNESLTSSLSDSLSMPSPTDNKSSMMSAKAGPAKNVMSFYGAESTGNSFCFVLDGSGSMRGGPWEAARQELLKSIGSLKPTQRFYIIFFNKDVLAISEPGSSQPASSPLLATLENLNHAKRWLDTLQITTGEPPMKAMELALEIECDCIYFLADGEMSESIAKRLLEMLRKKNRAMDILDGEVVVSPIHTIAYYSDKGLDIMRKIADENRGQFSYVPKPKSTRSGK